MMIFVKTLTGKIITIEVEVNNTFSDIKKKIEDQEGIPVESQRLTIAGKQVSDDKTVLDCDLQTVTIVHLVLRSGPVNQ
jgi:hypothetical protein